MVLPGIDFAGTVAFAEKLRQAVAELELHTGSATLSMTVSIGAAQAALGEDDPLVFLHDADSALLAAKKLGRNCVVCAPEFALSAAE